MLNFCRISGVIEEGDRCIYAIFLYARTGGATEWHRIQFGSMHAIPEMHSTLPSTEALIVYTALFPAAMKRECHSNDQAVYSVSAHPNAAHHVRLLSKSGKERAWAHWVVLSYAMMMDRMEPAFVTITHQSVRLAITLSILMIGLKFLIITCKRLCS